MFTRRFWMLGYIALIGCLLGVGWMVVQAQEGIALVFATNTAPAPALSFATNTPEVALLNVTFATNTPRATPEPLVIAPLESYGLRFWDEAALTGLLLEQVKQLVPGDADRRYAVRLLQQELTRRFPNAPRDIAVRQELIDSMLGAPRGSVDMRPFVRAYISAALNQQQPTFETANEFVFGGFNIMVMPANLDGDGRFDAIIQTRFPATVENPAEIRYQDFMPARIDENGVYQLLDSTPPLPAAPMDDAVNITLERLGDLTSDGLGELALSVEREDVNRELFIYGWRNGTINNLIDPEQRLLYGDIIDWPLNSSAFTVRELSEISPAWNCFGERAVTWSWSLNFFRAPETVSDFTTQNRLGCLLYEAEPLFTQPPTQALSSIDSLLPLALPEDAVSAHRAAMVGAMLNVLAGRPDVALETVRTLQTEAVAGTWLAEQTGAFLSAAEQPDVTPLKLCAALQAASNYGACDIDQVLARLFTEQPLSRVEPIPAQLARLGITVLDQLTISEVSRADREAVRFDLGGEHWWAFAPLGDEVYTAEQIEPPTAFAAVAERAPVILPPSTAYDALLVESDPTVTLNLLANTMRDNPNVPLAASARFLQAVCYEILGSRDEARQTYYLLWRDDPTSVWGQLAAAHLEQR